MKEWYICVDAYRRVYAGSPLIATLDRNSYADMRRVPPQHLFLEQKNKKGESLRRLKATAGKILLQLHKSSPVDPRLKGSRCILTRQL